jgi:twitching motility protein PilT
VLTDAQKKRSRRRSSSTSRSASSGAGPVPLQHVQPARRRRGRLPPIPEKIRSFQELHLPPVIAKLAERPRGLVLVTGPTGSGKSTTLAAMLDKINRERTGTSSRSRIRSSTSTSTRAA